MRSHTLFASLAPVSGEAFGGRVGGLLRDRFIGIDVQSARDCPYAVLDPGCRLVDSGWLDPAKDLPAVLEDLLLRYPSAAIGIDAPRVPLRAPRQWYWSRNHWRRRLPSEQGAGRHCEVVIKAHGIANPQWTPLAESAPAWMHIGFRLFRLLQSQPDVYEVFPSASYSLLDSEPNVQVLLSFKAFRRGPKDMLDAVISAATVREYNAGRGAAIGGGDALGEIILPKPMSNPIPAVLEWPTDQTA